MATSNNLRIIYNNLVDASTVTVSTGATASNFSVNSLKNDIKGLVWRSTSTTASLTFQLAASSSVSSVIFPFCNFSKTAQITVKLYTNTADSTPVLTKTVTAAPFTALSQTAWSTLPLGVNSYGFGGGTYARCYVTPTNCQKVIVDITDTNNTAGYLEISRAIIGTYWAPTYNTEYGLSAGLTDTSQATRTESGNLVVTNDAVYKTLNFNLSYLVASDRDNLITILRSVGTKRSIFVSLFPEDTEVDREGLYQIYGVLSSLQPITHSTYLTYASSIEIQEI